jgi:hypothetical protein
MQEDQEISITPMAAGLAAGIDDINRRLRAVLERSGGFRRRILPRSWTPPRVPCVGRDDELAGLKALLAVGRQQVRVCGPHGIGKTTLLYQAASRGILAADTVPGCAGVLRPGRMFRFADDLLRELFTGCYQARQDTVVPDDTVRRLLGPIRALVVLDGMSLPEDELRTVVEAMPDSTFVITATEPGLGHIVPVGGLSFDSSVRLMTDRLGEPLAEHDVRHLMAVWEDYGGHPGRLAGLAAYLRTAGRPGVEVRVPTPEELPLVVPRLVAGLGPSPRQALAVLASVPDAEWGARLLTSLSGTAERLGPRPLTALLLASVHDGRYRLVPHVSDHLPTDLTPPVAEIATGLIGWLCETARPAVAAGEADVIERTLAAALAQDQHLVAMVLARSASAVIMNSANWSAWRRILLLGRRAARAVGSVPDQMYFTYGLAAWATANRRTDEAVQWLELVLGASRESGETYAGEQAVALREQLEDAAFAPAELVVPVAAPGLLARLTPDALRTAKVRIGQLPAVQPLLRFAAENPVVVRVAIGAVAAVCAAAVALAALPPERGHSSLQAVPAPGVVNQPEQGISPTGTTTAPHGSGATPTHPGRNPVGAPNQVADAGGGPTGAPQPGDAGTAATTSRPPPPADHVDLDATDTDYSTLSISGVSFDSRQIQHLSLAAGPYTLAGPGRQAVLDFEITADHRVVYDRSLEGTFTGNGTSRFTVHGSRIALDSADIDYSTAGISGLPQQTTDRHHTFRILPGNYYVVTANGAVVTANGVAYFDVTNNGRVTYDSAMEGRLTGAGTATLAVHGFPITMDVTDVVYQYTGVNGTDQTTDRRHTYRLLPGPHHIVALNETGYSFAVTDDGHITYDPTLAGRLTGVGTTTLAVHGFPVTIDATGSGQADFSLAGVGTLAASRPWTLRLLPISNNLVMHNGQHYFFQVDGSGHVDYEHSLDPVLSGRGTSTLTVRS